MILVYKGFTTNVEYSKEDKVYHGKLLTIRDLVTWDSETLQEAPNQFHAAVDDYLDLLKEMQL